jgi:PDZ domain-containing secreted protein
MKISEIQLIALVVALVISVSFGSLFFADSPGSSLVGHVVTAIEDLKEEKQGDSATLLALLFSLCVILLAIHFYLRKNDVRRG